MSTNIAKVIKQHQRALDSSANKKTKDWWEKYMKGVIPFRGVGIPENRDLLIQLRQKNKLDEWDLAQQFELALSFFNEPVAEDKLAGILYLQDYLYDQMPWRKMLKGYETLYARQLIFDWNICDWFCVRVLSETIKHNGLQCAEKIASWSEAEYLWQARSGLVPFVNLAAEKQYYPYIHQAATVLIQRPERFAKTAVGWVLRDISRHDKKFVTSFVQTNLALFTKESLANALKYFAKDVIQRYQSRLKQVAA